MPETAGPETGGPAGTPLAGTGPAGAGPRWWLPVVVGIAALAVLVLALEGGHGLNATTITGLPDPGRFVDWALPVVTLLIEALGTLTVGLCVAAAFLLPGKERTVGAQGFRMLRLATGFALAWTVASLALLVLSVSDLLGQPLSQLGPRSVYSFAVSVSQGQALLVQAGMALVLAILTRVGLSRTNAACCAVLAVVAVLPPAFTGHAAGAGNHQIAVTSLALHVGAAALWVGGLAALLLMRRSRLLAAAAARYSRLALFCWVTVAISGVANAWVRLGSFDQLWRSSYGVLVIGKLAALVLLGGIGAAHRSGTLPALRAGNRRAFWRLAAGELVVFGATFGLAVALSRSPTPVGTNPVDTNPVVDILGFGMPPKPTLTAMISDVLPDMFFLAVTVAGTLAYLVGVWRLRRAGHRWPVARTASWIAGMVLLAAVTDLGVARYAYVLFSVHMAQHMVLSMPVPILLVGGAPLTLALRTLRRPVDPDVRGARDWLLIILHSRVMKVFTHPLVALALYVASLYGLYFSGLLGTLMRYHLGHLAMLTHFVIAGYLLFWVLIGIDPGRRQFPQPVLVLVHFAAMVFHAFFGVILLQSNTVISADWYTSVHPSWAPSLLSDQRLGASIAWAFGEIPAAVVFGILVLRWIRSDEREQARLDRAADRAQATGEEDELARYNAFLQRAAEADARRGGR
ncbi:cytochrome c oxidase assembly protein [Rugosimonospora africana]|uniref:cytochrome c oxidase assembly protein n=1 Tax=Rugosimonospora africana TaxID=556532 RepID=UPI001EF163AE|nr:cytochrome c oxidase assembly protein [Rugosimonospora africana]